MLIQSFPTAIPYYKYYKKYKEHHEPTTTTTKGAPTKPNKEDLEHPVHIFIYLVGIIVVADAVHSQSQSCQRQPT